MIVVIVVVVLLIIVALVVLLPRLRGQAAERKQTQARDHRQEAQRLAAEAESAQAAADEREAVARRERAEAELRAEEAQRDAHASTIEADRQRAEARRLEEKAAKLDPGYTKDGAGTAPRPPDEDATSSDRGDLRPEDCQDRPYADRRDSDATVDGSSTDPDTPRLADRRDGPGPTR